jgi:DNA-binding transcriptional regulator YdaS (Cro superfamily)
MTNPVARTPVQAVEAAIAFFNGNASAFAQAIDVSPQLVSFMRRGERRVPADKCPAIQLATKHTVRCEELRPDVHWDVLRMQAGQTCPDTGERRRSTDLQQGA